MPTNDSRKRKFYEFFENNKKVLAFVGALFTVILGYIAVKSYLFPPAGTYRVIILDTTPVMTEPFESGDRWRGAKKGIINALYLHDRRRDKLALRWFGGDCTQPPNTDLLFNFGVYDSVSVYQKLSTIAPKEGRATLLRAIKLAIDDFWEEHKRLEKEDEEDIEKIITVITASYEACNPEYIATIKETLERRGLILEWQVIGLDVNKDVVDSLKALGNQLGAKVVNVTTVEGLTKTMENVNLAVKFSEGKSHFEVGQDTLAEPFLIEAAEGGFTEARVFLGHLYSDEHEIHDVDKAIKNYKAAAEKGMAAGKTGLARLILKKLTNLTSKDAARLLLEAADLGDAEAMAGLGWAYEDSALFAQGWAYEDRQWNNRYQAAYHWYSKAAALGYAEAKISMKLLEEKDIVLK